MSNDQDADALSIEVMQAGDAPRIAPRISCVCLPTIVRFASTRR